MTPHFGRVAVLGLGLLGGSVALAARSRGVAEVVAGAARRAEVLEEGPEHAAAQRRLRARYLQLAAMALEDQPVIAIRIERVASWGDLRVPEA